MPGLSGAGGQTQGFVNTKQALYQQSYFLGPQNPS